MTTRSEADRFVRAFRKCLAAREAGDTSLTPFVRALDGIDATPARWLRENVDHPLLSRLSEVLRSACGEPDLITAVADLACAQGWYQVYTGEGINSAMSDFMLAKQVVGPKGLMIDKSIRTGIFLLAPHFEYPMHDHAALEVYYVHSGAIDIQNGMNSAFRRMTPGEYSVTPSEVPHALKTGAEPAMLLFVWTGDVESPIWWWVEGEDYSWSKTLAKKP